MSQIEITEETVPNAPSVSPFTRQKSGAVVGGMLILFLLIRIVGSYAPGWEGEISVSLLSVLFPFGLLFLTKNRIPLSAEPSLKMPDKHGWAHLVFLPAFLLIVILFAYVSSFLANLFDITYPETEGTFSEQLLTLAFLPALTEEFLCRFLLIRVLLPYGKRTSVFLSALLFALLHMNLAQIPYAFFAGLILGAITVSSESYWIPFLFHLANNLFSLLFDELGMTFFLVVCGILFLITVTEIIWVVTVPREKAPLFFEITGLLPPDRHSFAEAGRLLLSLIAIPALFCLLIAFL